MCIGERDPRQRAQCLRWGDLLGPGQPPSLWPNPEAWSWLGSPLSLLESLLLAR